jgi:AraC-like DNA-binding protein/ActR/RegA family two-component response regulator
VVIAVHDTGLGIPPEEQAWIFNEFRQSERTAARGYGGLGLGLAICKKLVDLHNGEISVQSSGEEGAGSAFLIRLPVLEYAPASAGPSQPFPGAVVLDSHIASQYGWELLRVLKGNPSTEDIPVLFYSLPGEGDTGSLLALDYLSKPAGSNELLKILQRQGWPAAVKGQAKTILIADDEPGFLEMYAEMIRGQSPDYRVLKAHDGREALDILRTTQVDLLLLDLMMPEVDGFGVLAQMREWESTRDTAVVVLTSKTITEDDMLRLSYGVAMVMSKGLYEVEEMLSHIETALTRNRKLGSESQRLVRKAMAYIHEHYTEQLSREALARHVNASDGHLARCFRQETGITPMAYLNRYRVNQAKTILVNTDQSITAVAMAVGFSDNNYFSRVFRQEAGCSPLVYRREHGV